MACRGQRLLRLCTGPSKKSKPLDEFLTKDIAQREKERYQLVTLGGGGGIGLKVVPIKVKLDTTLQDHPDLFIPPASVEPVGNIELVYCCKEPHVSGGKTMDKVAFGRLRVILVTSWTSPRKYIPRWSSS